MILVYVSGRHPERSDKVFISKCRKTLFVWDIFLTRVSHWVRTSPSARGSKLLGGLQAHLAHGFYHRSGSYAVSLLAKLSRQFSALPLM